MTDNTLKTISSSFIDAWDRCLIKLSKQLNPQVFKSYIENLIIEDFDESSSTAIIYTPSKFISKYVDQQFKYLITNNLNEILGYDVNLKFRENPNIKKKQPPITVVKRPAPNNIQNNNIQNFQSQNGLSSENTKESLSTNSAYNPYNNASYNNNTYKNKTRNNEKHRIQPGISSDIKWNILTSLLNPNYRFSDFVVGNNNQFCHAAAEQVAKNPGQTYNPLFIYGRSGLGKTHLLHAIGNEILANYPDYKVVYIPSEYFVNDVVMGIKIGKMANFREVIRNIDVLLIDDIQFLVGKDSTQEEFFHTFNALYNAKNQIVITSDKMPVDIPLIEERLLTRFSWGLIADVQAPDFETRVAILKRKAESEGFSINEDVAYWIAEHIFTNVRELEGALTRLHAFSSLQNVPISIELAENVFQHLYKPKKINITIDDIKGAVSNHFNIKVSDIISKRRTRNLSLHIHIAMYLCRKHTTCSYPEIGGKFGGRDHSSVIHATNVVSKKLEKEPETANIIKEIEKSLLS